MPFITIVLVSSFGPPSRFSYIAAHTVPPVSSYVLTSLPIWDIHWLPIHQRTYFKSCILLAYTLAFNSIVSPCMLMCLTTTVCLPSLLSYLHFCLDWSLRGPLFLFTWHYNKYNKYSKLRKQLAGITFGCFLFVCVTFYGFNTLVVWTVSHLPNKGGAVEMHRTQNTEAS